MKLTFKPNLGVALVFVPFRGEKTKSKINQYPLVLSVDIILQVPCQQREKSEFHKEIIHQGHSCFKGSFHGMLGFSMH